jgi:sarcosine/dimethylglycine N-methyltransferase
MSQDYKKVVTVARDYYDSSDAEAFYYKIWGGRDIHIGIYQSSDEDIGQASDRTVNTLLEMVPGDLELGRIIDLGSGYGGPARVLAKHFGCRVDGINISKVQNDRGRSQIVKEGLEQQVFLHEANFDELPFDDAVFDVVWSEDALLHSGDRGRTIGELVRVLRPGGVFVFHDPLEVEGVSRELLLPVLARINLSSMGSLAFYRETARACGLEEIEIRILTPHLITHYKRVAEELEKRRRELEQVCTGDYLERMNYGLQRWIEAGQAGHIAWALFAFRKRQ